MNRRFLVAAPLTLLLGACAAKQPHSKQIIRNFDAPGISRVILRASDADNATEINLPASVPPSVSIIGAPYVGTKDYSQPDLNWRKIPFSRSGVDFVSRRFGSTLVISTRNEISNHGREYTLQAIDLWLALPKSIHIVRELRRLTPDGTPDLSSP